MISKIISMLLSVLLFLQTMLPAALGSGRKDFPEGESPENLTSVCDYINYVQQYGAPSMDSETFFKALSPLTLVRRLLSGKIFYPEEESFIDVTLDEQLSEICGYLAENTGIDVDMFLNRMPNFGTAAGDIINQVIPLNTEHIRDLLYKTGDKARADGFTALSSLLYIIAMFLGIAERAEIYTVPREDDPDKVKVLMDVYYRDGTCDTIDPDIDIDLDTGHAFNTEGTGLAGTGFELDIYDLTLYTIVNSWQRKFGFGLSYDLFAARNPAFVYVTRRFKFSYAGKDWMIQIWKGNYAVAANGGEIGIYNREGNGLPKTFYKSVEDDEMPVFSMEISHGDDVLASRGPETTWWLTGFKLGKTIYLPESLTMKFSVTFTDEEMLKAFTAAIDGEAAHDVTYTAEGLTVNGRW